MEEVTVDISPAAVSEIVKHQSADIAIRVLRLVPSDALRAAARADLSVLALCRADALLRGRTDAASLAAPTASSRTGPPEVLVNTSAPPSQSSHLGRHLCRRLATPSRLPRRRKARRFRRQPSQQ